jgi:CheY-like chemotaxis protein
VVDADPGVRRTTLELLEIDGHTAQGAGSAREAAWLIERAPAFDLDVCDVVMPETDGLGFYHMLRASRPETAARFVFAASGLLPPETARSLAATGRPCLQKPLLLADLRRLLCDRQDTRGHGQG